MEIICHDCKKKLKKGAKFVFFEATEGDCFLEDKNKQGFVKCKKCFNKNKILKDFQPTEVYSRVVGYHSPTRRWNEAKKEEMRQRKVYNLEKEKKFAI